MTSPSVFSQNSENSLLGASIFSTSTDTSSINLNVSKWLDKTARLRVEQIDKLADSKWQPLIDQATGYNMLQEDYWEASRNSALWLKIKLSDQAHKKIWLELLPNIGIDGKMAIFEKGAWRWQQPVDRQSTGAPQPARYLTFLIDATQAQKTIYLRLTTAQTFQFSLKAHSADQLLWYFLSTNFFFGLVAGVLLLALIYNLAIGIYAREPVYLYYAFYVFSNILYSIVTAGYSRVLFPDWKNTTFSSIPTMILIVLSVATFPRKFLDTSSSLPRFDQFLKGYIVICALSLGSLIFVSDFSAYIIALSLGVPSPILMFIAGILSYRQGHPMARYFLMSWSLFLVSAGCWGFMWLGIIEPKDWVVWFYFSGVLLEVLLLSIVLGFRFNYLKIQTKSLDAAQIRYRKLSETDDLTRVLNRRGFTQKAEQLVKSYSTGSLVWLALDIDHFKSFNDQYGHPAGDDLLYQMGDLLNEKVKSDNIIGRIGGEEFALLLVNMTLAETQFFIDRLLVDFAGIKVITENGLKVGSTLSIGATEVMAGESVEQVWKRADDLLYQAKEKGRNRAVITLSRD